MRKNSEGAPGGPAVLVPRKLSEGWYSVFDGEHQVGFDRIYWEPHGDGTAWFEREARFRVGGHEVDRKVAARFRLGPRPALTWCRASVGDSRVEYALPDQKSTPGTSARALRAADALLPSALVAVLAAAARPEPGPVAEISVLDEWSGEAAHGRALVCDGPAEVEGPAPARETLKAARYRLVDRAGETLETYWVDEGKRLRRIDMGGPVAVLTSRSAARGEETGGAAAAG
jgi:hypothetical protein